MTAKGTPDHDLSAILRLVTYSYILFAFLLCENRFAQAMSSSKEPKLPPPVLMPPISEECRVCHDVVQTFRTMFPCPGTQDPSALNFDPLHARTSGFEEQFSVGCAFVGNCDVLTGKLRSRCYAMRESIEIDPVRRKAIQAANDEVCTPTLDNSFSRKIWLHVDNIVCSCSAGAQ